MPSLTLAQWFVATFGAVGIGLAKSGFSGFGLVYVLMFAALFGARESTGIVLPMLIFGDLSAVRAFHTHAQWPSIRRMLPPACLGILLAAGAMSRMSETVYKPVIGWITLLLAAVHVVRTIRPTWFGDLPHSIGFAWAMGLLSGATTMLANAAGPIFSLYALAIGLPKYEFVGTNAWFFLIINLIKVPFSYALGLIHGSTLALNVVMAPAILVGLLFGRWLTGVVSQQLFNNLLLALAAVAALRLIGAF